MDMVDQAVRAGQTGLEALVGMAEEDTADLRVGTRGKAVGMTTGIQSALAIEDLELFSAEFHTDNTPFGVQIFVFYILCVHFYLLLDLVGTFPLLFTLTRHVSAPFLSLSSTLYCQRAIAIILLRVRQWFLSIYVVSIQNDLDKGN